MNEILLNLIVFAGIAVAAGVILLIVVGNQRKAKRTLQQFAQQKGWQLDFTRDRLLKGYRITSSQWTLEAYSRSHDTDAGAGSSNMEEKTTWSSAQPGTTILVGPRTTQVNLGAFGEMLQAQVIQAALGNDAVGVKEVQIGGSAFQNEYMVWAQVLEEADRLLTPAVQSKLVNWTKAQPLIKRTSKGLTIELKGVHLKKAEDILDLVNLGESLL
jgi:hypothetical protein